MSTENYDPLYPDQPVVDQYLLVWARQQAFGSKPAFIWADDDRRSGTSLCTTALTYSQLNATVQRMARSLLETVSRADTVLMLASPNLRLVKLIFACQHAGVVAVPLIPPHPSAKGAAQRHLLRAVSQTKPAAAVADARYIDTLMNSPASAPLKSLLWLSVCRLESLAAADDNDEGWTWTGYTGCGRGETYLIQYSGAPRPVVVTAGAAAHNVRAARVAYALHPGSVITSWLPQYHDCGLMFLLLTLVAGATCVLASPAAFVRRPRLWLELVTEFKTTCTPVPSFALPLVLRRGRSDPGSEHGRTIELGSLRNLILVNEPIYKSSVYDFVEHFARAGLDASSVSPSYGLAENCTFVSTAWRGREPNLCSLPSYKKLLPSARLPPEAQATEIEIVVVDVETGAPVVDGVQGEIWISSPSNASGYLTHPSATRDAFCARLTGRPGTSFARTGDCGVVVRGVEERYLYVVGRVADAISIAANNGQKRRVHAHYIETAAFASAPGALRGGCVAALAATPPSSVAELQKGRGNTTRLMSDICDGIRRAVWKEEGIQVGSVVLVECGGLPKTTSGKLRRGAAKEKFLAGELPKVFVAHYADESTSTWSRDGSKESWVVLEDAGGKVAGMVEMASGNASQRLRLQSSL